MNILACERIRVVDTHTGGEPTRVVVDAPVEFAGTTMVERRDDFALRFDGYRRAVTCEPRGSDVMVGAWLTPPVNVGSHAGVIFFNNIGYLGMCGHGTIGVGVALAHLGRSVAGVSRLDTPVGTVEFELLDSARVRVANVPSYRYRSHVPLQVAGRTIHGDIAWGGNWFFICHDHGLTVDMQHLEELGAFSREIRRCLDASGIMGADGGVIDHVELFGPPSDPGVADGRNYVLCPGGAYDRSPCGTGTSAKIACLAADGKLAPGQWYRQQSVVGSIFEAAYQVVERGSGDDPDRLVIAPTLIGTAYVNAEAELLLRSDDPFSMGITT